MINLDAIKDKAIIYDTRVDIPKGEDTIDEENRLFIVVANVSKEEFERVKAEFKGRVGYTLIYFEKLEELSTEQLEMLRDNTHGVISPEKKEPSTEEHEMSTDKAPDVVSPEEALFRKKLGIITSNSNIYSGHVTKDGMFDGVEFIYQVLNYKRLKLIESCKSKVEGSITEDLFSLEALDTLEEHILALFAEKDIVTMNHVKNVFRFSKIMVAGLKAMNMELGGDDELILLQAALLHDLAKLVTPDQLLKNNDKFSGKEYDSMQKHADINAAFYFTGVISEVITLATQHHFTYDNDKGYGPGPLLKGEEISPTGRMLGVIDVFEAMTAKRPYQDPVPITAAFNILYTNSRPGKTGPNAGQFDPLYAKAFTIGFREMFLNDEEFRNSILERERSKGNNDPDLETKIETALDDAVAKFDSDQRDSGNGRKVGS